MPVDICFYQQHPNINGIFDDKTEQNKQKMKNAHRVVKNGEYGRVAKIIRNEGSTC